MDANTLMTMANEADALRWSRWQSIGNQNITNQGRNTMTFNDSRDQHLDHLADLVADDMEETIEIPPSLTIETRMLFIYVPPQDNGKVVSWLVSDPIAENGDLKFNKDFRLAFEFKDANHARQAYALMVMEEGYEDARVFGDMVL